MCRAGTPYDSCMKQQGTAGRVLVVQLQKSLHFTCRISHAQWKPCRYNSTSRVCRLVVRGPSRPATSVSCLLNVECALTSEHHSTATRQISTAQHIHSHACVSAPDPVSILTLLFHPAAGSPVAPWLPGPSALLSSQPVTWPAGAAVWPCAAHPAVAELSASLGHTGCKHEPAPCSHTAQPADMQAIAANMSAHTPLLRTSAALQIPACKTRSRLCRVS